MKSNNETPHSFYQFKERKNGPAMPTGEKIGYSGSDRPNKYALIEKRNDYIKEALEVVLKNEKSKLLKQPILLEELVIRELRRKSNYENLSDEHKEDFNHEFNGMDIYAQIELYFELLNPQNSPINLHKKLVEYYSK